MTQSDENKRIKKNMISALEKGNPIELLRAGLDGFLNMFCRDRPREFQQFIEEMGASHDRFILDTCRKENLKYIGGKMFIDLGRNKIESATIRLLAEYYFQKPNQEWIEKKKSGEIGIDNFTDWDTDKMAASLRETGKLEFSIEPPEEM